MRTASLQLVQHEASSLPAGAQTAKRRRKARPRRKLWFFDIGPEAMNVLKRSAAEAGMEPGEWIRWRALNVAAEMGIPVPAEPLERRAGHGN
ncbi:MAG: hypothetical protein JWM59_2938 [Verrucomicrobiales bacterium]|nr:hypothetical protein [Verrucomicrobiales bacterium]